MAGTTVSDDGTVTAFTTAAKRVDLASDAAQLEQMMQYVRETMGRSKIEVFRHLADGDEQRAQAANEAFEAAYAEGVSSTGCTPLPGAEESFDRLRGAGVKVALTTGFSRPTADAIIDALGRRTLVDLTLVPSEAGRGRPHPDLPLVALLRTGASRVSALAVAGDTTSDVECGLRAGASIAAGVLTGAHDRDELAAAGATHVFADVTGFADEVLSRRK